MFEGLVGCARIERATNGLKVGALPAELTPHLWTKRNYHRIVNLGQP